MIPLMSRTASPSVRGAATSGASLDGDVSHLFLRGPRRRRRDRGAPYGR